MSKKFGKDRSVSVAYAKIPLYYTEIIHPQKKQKKLVLMDKIGSNHYTACWRNERTCRTGIEFLVKATNDGFIFKNKEYKLKNLKKTL